MSIKEIDNSLRETIDGYDQLNDRFKTQCQLIYMRGYMDALRTELEQEKRGKK